MNNASAVFREKRKAFTLIEILVVIAIIGILASFVWVSVNSTKKKGWDGKRQAEINQINLAMEACYQDSNCGGEYRYPAVTAGANTVSQISTYLAVVPKDPKDVVPYQYTWTDNSAVPSYQYYCVYAKMESEADTYFCGSNKGVLKKTAASYTPTNTDCCGLNVTN